ncbi:glycosyltransferase family 2 protein [Oxalobacter paraformigenes]|uniref:Glycosyltransferase 2-like domain-containing protein n=1 Tax=Oxalobacter paraformigenes TaxID=556268 RepID=C3X2A2_9BURK|nr:glycosyltransferase family 2 protein [Oxalobacter paraformigenes]EEO27338.2 hypothetical protein OFAG_00491 [Oxalobacter paraformigenes]
MMPDSPVISVIISSYNHENYIKDTIRSIIRQTYKNLELIVIDDGSKDKTWERINDLRAVCEERFLRVIFKKQENKGTCTTMNELISLSAGEYTFGIASDDVADERAIELFYNFLSENKEYALVVGENKLIDADGCICYWDKNRNITYDRETAEYTSFSSYLERVNSAGITFDSELFGTYETLMLGNYIPNGYLVRKAIYELIGQYHTEAPLEDYWLMLQLSKYARMKFIRETTFYYRWHASNTIKNVSRVQDMTRRTYQCECKLLLSEKHKALFQRTIQYLERHYKKMLLSLGFFEIYKTRSLEYKYMCIKIKNTVFKFKYKKYYIF